MASRVNLGRNYYGWKIAGALALTETVSWGTLYYAFTVFLVPMQNEFGWSLAVLTGAYSLALLLSGLFAPLVGSWLDRRGPRALMTAGSILGVVCMLSWSHVNTVAAYYLTWTGIGIAMSATLYEPAFTTLAHWFQRLRSRAFLVVTIAAGFASTIFLPLSSILIERFGWRHALVLLAAVLAVSTIPPHALVLRRRPEDLGLRIDGAAADEHEPSTTAYSLDDSGTSLHSVLRQASFWLLATAFVLQTFATVAVAIMLIPYLTDRGEDLAFAATATGLIGAAQVLARVMSTAFERVSAISLTAAVFALQAVALGVLIEWQGHAGILTAVLLLGAGRGVVTLMRAQLIADFYGRTHYGAINGTLALFFTVAGSLAPICSGFIYGILNDYTPILWSMAALSLCAAAVMVALRQQSEATPGALTSHPKNAS